MSSFGINLDLKLNGETAVNRAVRGAKALEDVVRRINDKPLNLANIGGAARLQGLGDARKKVIALAEAINKGTKDVGKTEVAVRETLRTFTELAANTEKNTGTFRTFTAVVAKAEKELNEINRATENAKRAQQGLLSVEEEAAQLARKEQQAKAKANEAKARKENERQAKREADTLARLNRQQERDARFAKERQKRQRGRAIGDLAASIGFPLLFGGGAGSVVGGAVGSLAGSALGLGFGGQILGSALGQQFDKAAEAANRFATTVTTASGSLDQLIDAVGFRRTDTAASARFAETLGIGGVARAGLQAELQDLIGEKGVRSLEDLANSSTETANAISQFGARITSALAPAFTAVNKTITAVLGGSPAVQRLEQKEEDLAGLKKAGAQGFAVKRLEAEIAQLTRDSSKELKTQASLLEAITKIVDGQVALAKNAVSLEQSKLTARRDSLAAAQGNLAVETLAQELLVIQLELLGEISKERRKELELQEKLTEEQIKAAEAAKQNAIVEARRQIRREQMSGAIDQIQVLEKEQRLELQYQQAREGRFELFDAEVKQLADEFDSNQGIIELERKRALIGVTEAERISSINREYDLKARLAEKQFNIDKLNLQQADAAYKLSRLQVKQALELQRIQAATSAQQQIRQTSPFARTAELLDPYFGGSRQLEIDQQVAFREQLDLMDTQLKDVTEQLEIFALSPTVRKGLEDQEAKIKNQIASFKEYQPAIDQAALAQMRFNEAMAITVPVTDAVFDNLLAIVDGTKTAEEAFADFLRSISQLLMDAAKQMIATYISIGIARMFAGMGDPGSGQSAASYGTPYIGEFSRPAVTTGFGTTSFAQGGYVSGPTRAVVGEAGESEYVIPESKMRESMARYSRGARGSSVIPESGESGTGGGDGGGTAIAAPIDVRYTVERINDVEYVTAAQFQAGMQQAAAQGAQRGEQQTLRRLQMSGSTRRRIGL